MTKESKMIISHPNDRVNGTRLIVSITTATDEKEGCLTLRLQKQMPGRKWDEDNESVIYLSQIEIAKFVAVMRGYDESINNGNGLRHQTEESFCSVRFQHLIEPTQGYMLIIANERGLVSILLNTYEAISLCEVMQVALYHVVFG